MFSKKKFEEAAKKSELSERVVRDFMNQVYSSHRFVIIEQQKQIAYARNGHHIPDIYCSNGNWIEVKEDISSSKTKNLAFEVSCIRKLMLFADKFEQPIPYLAYVNHHNFKIQFFKVEELLCSLDNLVENGLAKKVIGGDNELELYFLNWPQWHP